MGGIGAIGGIGGIGFMAGIGGIGVIGSIRSHCSIGTMGTVVGHGFSPKNRGTRAGFGGAGGITWSQASPGAGMVAGFGAGACARDNTAVAKREQSEESVRE